MKTTKLLDKLGHLIESPEDLDKQRLKKLRKLIEELKAKQKKLEHDLKSSEDEQDRHRLERSIQVVQSQRKKGHAVYKSMKKKK
ncbi:MAG: hypothetical protein P8106_00045 [Gammaproteobacteria bacterium]|jgi:Skp family chaperone for outer membrane proteins